MFFKKLPAKVWVLSIIMLIGAFVRLYKIGVVPYGFTWDEAVITYDAWNISTWHRDLWGNLMPLTFKSFGDYKAPLMIYVLSAVFSVIEVNDSAIRIISALAGTALIPITYLLSIQIFKEKKEEVALLAASLIALSPWSIHFSRIGFEANLAITIVALGVLLFLLSRKKPWLLPVSVLVFLSALFTYHSAKLVIPFLLIMLIFRFKNSLQRKKTVVAVSVISLLLGLIPFMISIRQGGAERGKQALIFYNAQDQLILNNSSITHLASNIAKHASLDFWVLGEGQENLRQIVPGYGVMYWASFALFLIGLVFIIKDRSLFWLFIWLAITLVPSIVSRTSPHTIRASLAIPVIQLMASFGAIHLFHILEKKNMLLSRIFVGIIALSILVQAIGFWQFYWDEYAKSSALDFQYGYKQAVQYLKEEEKTADKVIMTDEYGQAFVYVLLYKKLTAQQFQQGALANYEFRDINWPGERRDSIFAATPDEIPFHDPTVEKIITVPGTDKPVWIIARTQEAY